MTDQLVFLQAKEHLSEMALKFRTRVKSARTKQKETKTDSASSSSEDKQGSSSSSNKDYQESNAHGSDRSTKENQTQHHKSTHTQNWPYLLPADFPHSGEQILDNMIIEAASLKVSLGPHASCMLYRSLLEGGITEYVKKSNNFENVKNHYFTSSDGKKKNHTQEQKKNRGINLDMCVNWLVNNHDLFPLEDRKKLKIAVGKVKAKCQKLNGVVHCLEMVSEADVVSIRNETIPILEFFITQIANSQK